MTILGAVAMCSVIAATYVGLFYIWPGSQAMQRDHPRTVMLRSISVAACCTISWLPLCWMRMTHKDFGSLYDLLGLRWNGALAAVVFPTVHTAVFFLGPLIHRFHRLYDDGLHGSTALASIFQAFITGTWHEKRAPCIIWRNLVMAPIGEEWVFRACMTPLLRLAGCSITFCVLVSPLFFGLAHLHHLRELVVHQRRRLDQAVQQVIFQFTYTTVFGWYATFVFLKTGHLLAAIMAHTTANWMAVPNFAAMFRGPHAHMYKALTVAGVLLFWASLAPVYNGMLYLW